jgi:hypothetical protein
MPTVSEPLTLDDPLRALNDVRAAKKQATEKAKRILDEAGKAVDDFNDASDAVLNNKLVKGAVAAASASTGSPAPAVAAGGSTSSCKKKSKKTYIKSPKGKRLVRKGPRGGKYYIYNGKKKYITKK